MTKDPQSKHAEELYQGYVINDQGEEIPITEAMLAESLSKIKLKSIGTHTGYTKAITDDMVEEAES